MKKLVYFIAFIFCFTTFAVIPQSTAFAADQTAITRSDAEQRALKMINLSWTYTSGKNNTISPAYTSAVTLPQQFNGVTTAQETGIPYNWGGFDGLDTNSYNSPWTNFLDAVDKGAYTGNVNSTGGYGLVPGTAGLDCSGFVQAVFNIHDYKLSTSTLFDHYFTKINMSDLKHMDILNKPGWHTAIFDRWGTLNGISGAYTYEATTDQTFGGIQGTKEYFLTMNQINNGYIPGRYINIVDDAPAPVPVPAPVTSTTSSAISTTPAPAPAPTTSTTSSAISTTPTTTSTVPSGTTSTSTPTPIPSGIFAQVVNVATAANFRAAATTSSSIIGTIPKGTILYLINYSSGWYQVSYNGVTGWIYGNLIGTIPSGKYVTVKSVSVLNIRNVPSTTSSIIGTLGQGQYAEVLGYSSDGSWMNISINGITGWSYKGYLSYIY